MIEEERLHGRCRRRARPASFGEPFPHRREALEDRRPDRIVGLCVSTAYAIAGVCETAMPPTIFAKCKPVEKGIRL
jgi:hypothetical protein